MCVLFHIFMPNCSPKLTISEVHSSHLLSAYEVNMGAEIWNVAKGQNVTQLLER